MPTITVHYYAILREQAGVSSEKFRTDARTPRDLYRELTLKHSFSLPEKLIKAAVNDEFTPLDTQLQEDDKVTFIPPVAGG